MCAFLFAKHDYPGLGGTYVDDFLVCAVVKTTVGIMSTEISARRWLVESRGHETSEKGF